MIILPRHLKTTKISSVGGLERHHFIDRHLMPLNPHQVPNSMAILQVFCCPAILMVTQHTADGSMLGLDTAVYSHAMI